MEEWLRKLMSAIGGGVSQPQVTGTPPFVQKAEAAPPSVVPSSVPIQPRPQIPEVTSQAPPAPATTTPEQQLAAKLQEYNAVAQRDPKLKHNLKNNLLQGLFVGLQGLQRVADPERAPQGPIKYLGNARKEYELNQMSPMIQSLGSQVNARTAARKEDLATRNVESEIGARDSKRKIDEYNVTHPGMETIKDDEGNILERPKGSTQPYKPAGGIKPVKKSSVVLPSGERVEVPTMDAVRYETQKQEKENERLYQTGKINYDTKKDNDEKMDAWRKGEDVRGQQIVTWTNEALAKDDEAKRLRKQAEGIAGTKEALDLQTKADAAEVERDRLFNQAKTSSPADKPKLTGEFKAPAGTVPGKKVTKANDPYNLLN